ncbi:MAG: hypothetical protein ACK5LJ_10285 [Paracoccus sp. (in: a-proteobacteria)]
MPSDLSNTADLKKYLLDNLRGKTVVNQATGRKVGFFRPGIESSLKTRSLTVRKMYMALPELIENAVPINYEENTKEGKQHRQIAGYSLLQATAKMDGEEYLVNIKVDKMKNDEDGNPIRDDGYYYHGIEDVKIKGS